MTACHRCAGALLVEHGVDADDTFCLSCGHRTYEPRRAIVTLAAICSDCGEQLWCALTRRKPSADDLLDCTRYRAVEVMR